ncbi:MAG: InlB B-repeat-containing protein [Clostridiales bacterium]|nr:InlB B-repeat-containing protein [Clostridiales bacterium]
MKLNFLKRLFAFAVCSLMLFCTIGVVGADGPVPGNSLWVCGTEVTASNASNVLGDGKVSYNFDTNTLTFTAKPTNSGLHEGAIIYSDMENLTIVTPTNGLTLSNGNATKGIWMTAGSLTVNGNLTINLSDDSAEAAIWVEVDCTINGKFSTEIYGDDWIEESRGIYSNNGDVTVNGGLDIIVGRNGIFTRNGNISVSGTSIYVVTDSLAEYEIVNGNQVFCPAGWYVAMNGGVEIDGDLVFEFGNAYYCIYANGPVSITGTVNLNDSSFIKTGIVSEWGGISCGSDATLKLGKAAMISRGDGSGITVNGDVVVDSTYNGAFWATEGEIYIDGSLQFRGGKEYNVRAKNDITIKGDAEIKVETYNPSTMANRAICSDEGSITVEGYLKVTGATGPAVYAHDNITISGDATIGSTIRKVTDYVMKAETGTVSVAGNLTTTGAGTYVVYSGVDIEVLGSVSINEVFYGNDNMSPEGTYGLYSNGEISVSGTLTITANPVYGTPEGTSYPVENGVYAEGKITIIDKWDVLSGGTAIYAEGGITKPSNFGVTTPEGGVIVNGKVMEADRTTPAAHAVIEEVDHFTVTFINGEDTIEVEVAPGAAIGDLIPTVTKEGWKLIGWFDVEATTADLLGTGTELTAETVVNGNMTVYAHWYLPGDVNGDGKVNNKDVNRLLQYLAGDENLVYVARALDINGDSKINNKDVNRLLQFLAGDDVEIF